MNNDFLRDLLVVVPSVVEQAEILQEIEVMALQVDQLEEAMHKQIQLLRERRQTLITASVTGQINSVGDAA